ncbi:MAG TPA: preprotein translocase subunit SecG [Opitutaceae bacterium]|jgi:preprotein translocase subunit SecG
MNILLGILTFALVLVSLFLILVVLMQRAKSDAGMGAVMGGSMAEATFGADTTNVLSQATIRATVIFFILAVVLFLGRIYQHTHLHPHNAGLPSIAAPSTLPAFPSANPTAAPASSKPAAPAPASPKP